MNCHPKCEQPILGKENKLTPIDIVQTHPHFNGEFPY